MRPENILSVCEITKKHMLFTLNIWTHKFLTVLGVVGCGEAVVYLMSPGRSTDIGLRLGKACPCSR